MTGVGLIGALTRMQGATVVPAYVGVSPTRLTVTVTAVPATGSPEGPAVTRTRARIRQIA